MIGGKLPKIKWLWLTEESAVSQWANSLGSGARGSVVVKALCYKPEGRGFDTRWGEFLNLPNPSGRTRHWGLLSLEQKWVPET
jgi:hypothetical protein